MKWKGSTLGEVVSSDRGLIQTGPFGSQLHQSDYTHEGTPVIMPTDISDGRVSTDRIAFVSEQTAERMSRHKLRSRTIVLPRRGDITKRAFIRDDQEGWLCGSGCLKIEVQETDILPEFLYYYMGQHEVLQWLDQHAVGSTMLNLSAGIVTQMPVNYPEKNKQKHIASILSAYDEQMENHRRRMGLLEKAARLLYEEWFVRLRFPGHEHTPIINGLPQGWERKTAHDAIEILSGGTPKTSNQDFWGGEIPFYTPKDATDGFWVTDCERTVTELGLQNCNSHLYPKETVFISARGTVGRLNLAQRPMAMSQSCYALKAKGQLSQLFLFCAMQVAVEELRHHAVGAVFDAIIVDTFKHINLLIPEPRLVHSFDEMVKPVFAQLENLTLQNQKLRAARDLLLPRLMSGEMEV